MSDCLICFRDIEYKITIYDYFKKRDVICGACKNNFKVCNKNIIINELEIYSLYYYDDFIENLLFQFKESRDVALKQVFIYRYLKMLNHKYHDYVLVYVPSSSQKNKERGFFPLELIYENLTLDKLLLFEKRTSYKQSLQEYHDRINIKKVIKLIDNVEIPSKVLLVDDMCTSGNSLNACFNLIKNKCEVKALVVCINPKLLEFNVSNT